MEQAAISLEEYIKISRTLGIHPSETREKYGYYETEQHTITDFLCALYNAGLLKTETRLIDVGCGLCTTLFNFYQQSKEKRLDKLINVKFHGVECDVETAIRFEKNLLQFFNGNLTFCVGEAEEMDYSNYDFIYLYSPMKLDGMDRLYDKIFSEISSGTIVYDNYMYGKGLDDIIEKKSKQFNLKKVNLIFGELQHTVWIKDGS